MEEKAIVKFKKDEFAVKEYVKTSIGRGKVSRIRIEYTPIGEKIIISTHKAGLIIGRGGERIDQLTKTLKTKFSLENPHIEIDEIKNPEFDAQLTADDIASGLERFGPLKFKVLAYRALQKIIESKALGAEIRLSGKLPGARAKTWRFAQGFLKKTGDTANVVDRAQARAETKPGTVGVKVSIMAPDVILKDKIVINENMLQKLKMNAILAEQEFESLKATSKKKSVKSTKKEDKTEQ